MSLHDKILNLPGKPGMYTLNHQRHVSYMEGHRDARHAAAELACAQDAPLEALIAAIDLTLTRYDRDCVLSFVELRAAVAAAKEQP